METGKFKELKLHYFYYGFLCYEKPYSVLSVYKCFEDTHSWKEGGADIISTHQT